MKPTSIDLAHVTPVRIGSITLDPGHRTMHAPDGESRRIEPQVVRVILTLAEANGAILSRADIIAACWQGRAVSDDALDRVISIIRRLGRDFASGSFGIETIPRIGYRLEQSAAAVLSTPTLAKPTDRPRAPSRASRRAIIGGALAMGGLLAASLSWQRTRRPNEPVAGSGMTLAIMPFTVSAASELPGDLGRTVAHELYDALTRIGGVRVIADYSSFKLAASGLDLADIGLRLGAGLIITGNLQQDGSMLRADQSLIRLPDQSVMWTSSATGTIDDIPALKMALAGALVQAMVERLGLPVGTASLLPQRRVDGRAFAPLIAAERALMRCRALLADGNENDGNRAGDLAFRQATRALEVDPHSVRALFVLWTLARNGYSQALDEQRPEKSDRADFALSFIRRALLADPNDPIALTALGDHLRRVEWHWDDAEMLLRRAIAIAPALVEARYVYANLLGTLGRVKEGVAEARELVRLDPENGWRRNFSLPRLEYLAGDLKAAIADYFSQFHDTPKNLFYATELYLTWLTVGNAPSLRELADQIARGSQGGGPPDGEMRKMIARIACAADAIEGRPRSFLAILDKEVAALGDLNQTRAGERANDRIFILALEYAWAKQTETAIALLSQAIAARSLAWPASLPFGPAPFPAPVSGDPRFAAIWHSDPRLADLLARRSRYLRGA